MSLARQLTLMLVAIVACAPLPARAVDTAALRRKQDAQERAREMARQMVTGILDVQLQQLEENGLEGLPLYRDIAGMKKTIGSLVDHDMERAVELLVKAQQAGEKERDEAFKKARGMIREIVMRLAAERQNLMRRLKSAELSAQVKRLIDMQSKVWQATKTLPDRPPAEQEASALAAIEDQRDVKQLFLQLVDALSDVSQWGGAIGAGAADGLRILQAASVGKELDSAGSLLGALRYSDAAKSQQLVLKGLRLLQEKLEDTQGLLGSDRLSALALARQLIEQQQALRNETRKADLVEPAAERLVERQAAIRKELNKVGQALGSLPAAEPLLEQAKVAAYEATGRLFDARQEEALAEQGKVLGNLAEIAEQLASAADANQSDKSAAELERQVNDLERAKADLDRIRDKQFEVDRTAPENASRAGMQEQRVTEELAKVDDNRKLPNAVVSRLESAEQAAAAAARALEKGEAKSADPSQRQLVETADRAIERAAAEIEAALDDARRMEAGVKVGELARAAEALERAAAAQRRIADATQEAAKTEGLGAEAARNLSGQQAELGSIAKKVADGVEQSAAEAAQLARSAAKDAASAHERLEQAASKPGAASKPAAGQASDSAAAAAEKLAQAAANLRKGIDKAAESLAAESSRQLEKVSPVRAAIDEALANAEAPLSDRIERLLHARRAIREALTAQERAAGRPSAADAMQMENALGEALAAQAQADRAAEQLAQGKSSSPLGAITGAQAVAEQSARLADAASKRPEAQQNRAAGKIDPLTESLQKATRAAGRAARAALDGKHSQSDAARDEARRALAEAAQMAAAEAEAAAASPRGKPDAAAQKQVSESAAKAAQLAGDDAPPAAQSLAAAEKSSGEALQEARSGNPAKTAAAQEQTAKSLKAAQEQLAAALKQIDRDRANQMTREADAAGELAARSAAVDPGALAALRSAQTRSARAANEPPGNASGKTPEKTPGTTSEKTPSKKGDGLPADSGIPDETGSREPQFPLLQNGAQPGNSRNAQHQSHKDMERAAAILNARQQRVERDKAIAEALRRMAQGQQESADEIARQSAELLDSAASSPAEPDDALGKNEAQDGPVGSPKSQSRGDASPRHQAATRLSKALRDFASAQRGTGEAAQELSRQSQIANRPLRDALERASNLPAQDLPMPTGSFSKGSQKINPNAPGNEAGSGSKTGAAAGQKQSGSGRGSGEKKAGLGTGFVPDSPEATAEMMAGAAAAKAAAELAGAGLPNGPGSEESVDGGLSKGENFPEPGDGESAAKESQGEGEGQAQGSSQGQGKGSATSTATGGGASKAGQFRLNEQLKQGMPQFSAEPATPADSRTGNPGPRDSNAAARALGQESWFTKLPPDLRKAIRAKAQRPPPRSYEEKLQKYFESID